MNTGNKGFRGKNPGHDGQTNVASEVGNRKTYEEIRVPLDNVGNVMSEDPIAVFVHDGLGNSQAGDPAHLKSGILMRLVGPGSKNQKGGRLSGQRPRSPKAEPERHHPRSVREPRGFHTKPAPKSFSLDVTPYLDDMVQELEAALKANTGETFAFSMRPIRDNAALQKNEDDNLAYVERVVAAICSRSRHDATISQALYQNPTHAFAVLFVDPAEQDPVKNKQFISALRMVVSEHIREHLNLESNIFVVLQNAAEVLEKHFAKIGAHKKSGGFT